MRKIYDWFESTWLKRSLFMFIVLWLLFFLTIILCDDPGAIVFFSIIGIIAYIIGSLWILKRCSARQPENNSVHWIDLFIRRITWSFWYFLITGAATGILFAIDNPWRTDYVAQIIFSAMCVLSWIVAMFLVRLFIKQSLITEANIKAQEMYNGKKRAVPYKK